MKSVLVAHLIILALAGPALARSRLHVLHPRSETRGTPITAGSGEIRVDSAGQVITSSPPILRNVAAPEPVKPVKPATAPATP